MFCGYRACPLFLAVAIHVGNIEDVEVADIVIILILQEIIKLRTQVPEHFLIKILHRCGCHGIVKFKDSGIPAIMTMPGRLIIFGKK